MKYQDFDALIFDMDGVITDTEPLHIAAEQQVCRECGLDAPAERWQKFRGRTTFDIFADLVAEYGGNRELLVPELAKRKADIYLELAKAGLPTVPGALDFIPLARPHFRHIGLATSSEAPIQRATFTTHHLDRYFDAITNGSELAYGKPHPEAYLKAVAKAAAPAARCLVIEDSDNGIKAACGAGCRVIGITTSFPAAKLKASGADWTFDTYEQIAAALGLVKRHQH